MMIKIDVNTTLAKFLYRFFAWTGLALAAVAFLAGSSFVVGASAASIFNSDPLGAVIGAAVGLTQLVVAVPALCVTLEEEARVTLEEEACVTLEEEA